MRKIRTWLLVVSLTGKEFYIKLYFYFLSCTKYRVSAVIVNKSMPSFQLKIFIWRSPEPRKEFKITFFIMLLLSLCGSNSSATAIGPISLRFPHNMCIDMAVHKWTKNGFEIYFKSTLILAKNLNIFNSCRLLFIRWKPGSWVPSIFIHLSQGM